MSFSIVCVTIDKSIEPELQSSININNIKLQSLRLCTLIITHKTVDIELLVFLFCI